MTILKKSRHLNLNYGVDRYPLTNLGPEPLEPKTAFVIFNCEYIGRKREKKSEWKVEDLMKRAAKKWENKMSDSDRKPY